MILTSIRKAMAATHGILINNEKGITLTEIIAALAVSALLVGMAAITLLTFFGKYKELTYYAQLQQDAFDLVETVKYGYPFKGIDEFIFLGVANSSSLTLDGTAGSWGLTTSRGVSCIPDRAEEGHSNDYVRYYYDGRSASIMVQGLYGPVFKQEQIFPSRNQELIKVTDFRIRSLTGSENPRLISIELEAEISLSTDPEDVRVKKVSYSTNVALGR